MYKCILCCWWTENLSVIIDLIDEVIKKKPRIFKWRSILRNIMPHMYLYPKCAIIDKISIYIHYILFSCTCIWRCCFYYCGDRIWIENFCFDRQLWQQRKQFRWRPLNPKKMTFQRKRIFSMVSLLFCTYG